MRLCNVGKQTRKRCSMKPKIWGTQAATNRKLYESLGDEKIIELYAPIMKSDMGREGLMPVGNIQFNGVVYGDIFQDYGFQAGSKETATAVQYIFRWECRYPTYEEVMDRIDFYDAAGMVVEPVVQALRSVVELHRPFISSIDGVLCSKCREEDTGLLTEYPCPTVLGIVKGLK